MSNEGDALLAVLSSSDDSGDEYEANGAEAPVTIGGFVEDEEDDDDDEEQKDKTADAAPGHGPDMTALNGDAIALAPAVKPSPKAPSASLSTVSVPNNASVLDSVTSPAGPGTPQIRSTDTSVQGKPDSEPASATLASAASSLPKAPLPHDIVGIFEHRIKQDPQGDIDAWLGLVAHHRLKQRYDEARKVYTRFFQVFPTAVSKRPVSWLPRTAGADPLFLSRQTNGSRMLKWSKTSMI